MGDLMNIEPTEDELDLAVEEFTETYKAFEKAARKLMAIMESMNKKRNQELCVTWECCMILASMFFV